MGKLRKPFWVSLGIAYILLTINWWAQNSFLWGAAGIVIGIAIGIMVAYLATKESDAQP